MFRPPQSKLVGFSSTPNLHGPVKHNAPGQAVSGNPGAAGNGPPILPRPTLSEFSTESDLQLPQSRSVKQHNRQDSGSATYNLLDYYTDTYGSEEEEAMSNVKALGNGTPNLGIDTLVDSGSTEPFTLVSNDISIPPTDSSSSTLGYTNGKRGRRNPITRKESYASLKKSRTSLELIRNKIGESMATRSDDKIHLKRINKTTKNSILHSGQDRYGFKKANNHISEGEYDNWWVSYSQYLIKRKKKWEKMMAKNGLPTANNVAPTRFPPRSESLRKFVRKGIPAEWRGNAWFYFARGSEKLRENKGVYDRLVDQTMDIINENTEAIEKDLHRTFPENIHFKNIRIQQANGEVIEEESPLLQTLRRVLKCFSLYRPSVGYCQSLNFIAGLLLIYMDEERAFWMLVIISERYLPGIHDFNLEGVNVHQGVLLLCLRQYLPDVWGMIVDKNDVRYQEGTNAFLYDLPALSFCTTSWFMSIFIGVLPTETTLRVWDCLFYEDSKTIFQIALTIFKMMEPELHRIADRDTNEDEEFLSSELFQVIQNFPKKLLDVNRMMEECFRFSNFSKLTQDEVVKCKQYVIESRSRYHNLIKKRSAIGLKESDRKELIKSSEMLENKKIGLKALNWNGKLNHRMRRLRHKLR